MSLLPTVPSFLQSLQYLRPMKISFVEFPPKVCLFCLQSLPGDTPTCALPYLVSCVWNACTVGVAGPMPSRNICGAI